MADFSITIYGNPMVDWSFMDSVDVGGAELTDCVAVLVGNDPGMLANPIAISQICGASQSGGGGGGVETYTKTLSPKQQQSLEWLSDAQKYLQSWNSTNPKCLNDLSHIGLTPGAVEQYAANSTLLVLTSLPDGVEMRAPQFGTEIQYDLDNFGSDLASFNGILGTLVHEMSHLAGLRGSQIADGLRVRFSGTPTGTFWTIRRSIGN